MVPFVQENRREIFRFAAIAVTYPTQQIKINQRQGYIKRSSSRRHASWLESEPQAALKRHNIAWCISDTVNRYPYLEAVTSDFIYVRLHGSGKLYASEYTENELQEWKTKIDDWGVETDVYLDNDASGYAPKNAVRLKEIMGGV